MGTISAYLLYNSIFLIDLWDAVFRFYWRMKHTGPRRRIMNASFAFPTSIPLELPPLTGDEKKRRLKPFAIVLSVYNAEGYIREFLENFRPYLDKILIVDDCSTDATYRVLEEYGIRYIRNERNMKKPASIKRALADLPKEVETVVVFDPDTRIVESGLKKDITDLEEVLSDFQRSGMDGCAPRIKVKEGNSLINKLQELEYSVSLSLGRKSLSNKTVLSGIAIYKRKSLEKAMESHPLSVYAEDFMTSLLILNNGGSIYYDGRLLAETEVPSTWRRLMSQRIGWDYGYIKAYFHTLKRVLQGKDERPLLFHDKRPVMIYSYVVYLLVFGLLFHPVKLTTIFFLSLSLINLTALFLWLPLPFSGPVFTPILFLSFYAQYSLLALAMIYISVGEDRRSRYLGLVPVYTAYALFLLLVRTVGFLNYPSQMLFGRRIYHDHFESEPRRS